MKKFKVILSRDIVQAQIRFVMAETKEEAEQIVNSEIKDGTLVEACWGLDEVLTEVTIKEVL